MCSEISGQVRITVDEENICIDELEKGRETILSIDYNRESEKYLNYL